MPVVIGKNFETEFKIVINLTNLGKDPVFIKAIRAISAEGREDNMEVLRFAAFPTREIQSNQLVRIDFDLEGWLFSPYNKIQVETTRGKVYTINKKALDKVEKTILKECSDWPNKKAELLKLSPLAKEGK